MGNLKFLFLSIAALIIDCYCYLSSILEHLPQPLHTTSPFLFFLKLNFIGFAMLLLERTFWIFALVGSFAALSAY